MTLHLGKFVHTETGRTIMSILLGLGLATLFRNVCKGKKCFEFHAPPFDDFKDKIYKNDKQKCVKFVPVATKCSMGTKTITFE